MKKSYLIALAFIVLLLVVAYFKLFLAQANFHQSIDSKTGVFVVEKFNNTNIRIATANVDKIIVNLSGPEDEIDRISFYSTDNNGAKFTFSDEWQELSGTITVPEGTLIDIRLENEVKVIVDNHDINNSKSFLIDTNSVDSISFGDGLIFVESSGDVVIWDNDNWASLESSEDGGEGGSLTGSDQDDEDEVNNIYVPAPCSVGSQSIRNYCCERLNDDDVPIPVCDGFGYYVFNNVLRECEFRCEEEEEDEDEETDVVVDCSIGSQSIRNTCCAQANIGADTSYCVGEWQFNNSSRICNYHCFTEDELEEYFDDDGGSGQGLRMCENFDEQEDMDECCDFSLRNELLIGPRSGFPDCIGRWYFDKDDGCSFRCAEYHEMQEIIKELRERAKEIQEEY